MKSQKEAKFNTIILLIITRVAFSAYDNTHCFYKGRRSPLTFAGIKSDPPSYSNTINCPAGMNKLRIAAWFYPGTVASNGFGMIFSYHSTIKIAVHNNNGEYRMVVKKQGEGIVHSLRLFSFKWNYLFYEISASKSEFASRTSEDFSMEEHMKHSHTNGEFNLGSIPK